MKRVLVVDDDRDIHDLLRVFLSDTYDLTFAGSGEDALGILQDPTKRPDLFLLDYEMPGMNARELKEKIDLDPELKPIPVIYLSADSENSDRVKHAFGFDFLNKPILKEDLLYIIDTVLKLSE